MKCVLSGREISSRDRSVVGGKAVALAELVRRGMAVPEFLCVTTDAYRSFLNRTNVAAGVAMELDRKDFSKMRWEEMWDTSLRIRNLFLTTEIPKTLQKDLIAKLSPLLAVPLVVRSSAPSEDQKGTSFAGLHDSVVNVRGVDALLRAIRTVWASLWSDRALLYRRELGLSLDGAAMAVIVQQFLPGEKSGVVFSQSPMADKECWVEAVWGLNEGMVEGTVAPDRWRLNRDDGRLLGHIPAHRETCLEASPLGVSRRPLYPDELASEPLTAEEVQEVFRLGHLAELIFGAPQDVEWTMRGHSLHPLQSRPVTARPNDERSWYLSLHRSFDNLQKLRRRVEEEVIPGMEDEAGNLAKINTETLPDSALADEIRCRRKAYHHWEGEYRRWCIPLAHGVRLFGQIYNDFVVPEDPFSFLDLLIQTEMLALERNRSLGQMAAELIEKPALLANLKDGWSAVEDRNFLSRRDLFLSKFDFETGQGVLAPLRKHLLELARSGGSPEDIPSPASNVEQAYLEAFPEERREFAANVLELARASYRLRDNDNISLGKIRHQLLLAEEEARRRLVTGGSSSELQKLAPFGPREFRSSGQPRSKNAQADRGELVPRQLTGQPAGRGVGTGKARLIRTADDLLNFESGEVLVCDAVDPTMTFVVPLAAAIVERRGGMLIHGAIIAREYGLACVTGVPEAMEMILDGDQLTVDGYLGIVVVEVSMPPPK